jgi:hypothetical protein
MGVCWNVCSIGIVAQLLNAWSVGSNFRNG